MKFVRRATKNREKWRPYWWRVAHAGSVFAVVTVVLSAKYGLAVPACPEAALVRQPDGTLFFARKEGDERSHFTETEDGYTIIQDPDSGFWVYATAGGEVLAKSNFAVGKVSPKALGLRKHLRPGQPGLKSETVPMQDSASPTVSSEATGPGGSPPTTAASFQHALGPVKSLVIPARFTNHLTFVSREELDDLFNESGYSQDGAAGSVRDYYLEVSANQLTVDSTVTDWVFLPHNESFYGANNGTSGDSNPRQLVRDAIRNLDLLGFDFRPFDADGDGIVDMVTVVHSGLGEEYGPNPSDSVWSQVVSLTPPEVVDGVEVHRAAIAPERRYDTLFITRIGVICHEMGHLLGLPDLYDRDGSSYGIGVWGGMSTGSWGGDSFSPERPVHFCCWSKIQLGWLEPAEIEGSDSPVSVPGIEKSGTWGVYKISCEMPSGEYFLIENRRQTGFDRNLPESGLLIWHVDDNQPQNDDESHYRVALLQADGRRDLEEKTNEGDAGDPFPGNTNQRRLDDTTTPGTATYADDPTFIRLYNISDSSSTMSFEISTLSNVYTEDFSGGLPGDWQIVDGSNDGYTWTDLNPGSRSHPSWSAPFMIADSDAAGRWSMNEQLVSSAFDCFLSGQTHVKFDHHFREYSGQTGDLDVRIDGGKWQNVARYQFDDSSGRQSIDISSLADGRSSVEVRWRFYSISFGWYWGIDNFAIRGELPDNLPPQIEITGVSQRLDDSRRVEIQFLGTDPENDPASWVAADCQYAPAPFATWYPLVFDTADPANTALEPMPFVAGGQTFVAVVDTSGWNGYYKVKLRVTNGAISRPAVVSDEFRVDSSPPVITTPTHLGENPLSGVTSVTAWAEWDDSNPGTTWFQWRLNGGLWSDLIQGEPIGEALQSAIVSPLPLDGDDYLAVKSYHVDAFANRSEESISPDYYVTPLAPSFPSVRDPTRDSLRVTVRPNPSEGGDVDYALYCSTTDSYANWETGRLGVSPTWGDYTQWGGPAGMTVVGLKSKTSYSFRVMASNPRDHEERSDLSPPGNATTLNSPPNPPLAVAITPEEPLTADNLLCRVTPASPPDVNPQDTVHYRFTWSCPGALDVVHGPRPSFTDTLASYHTRKSQTWTCTVEPYDLTDYGPAIQRSVVIGNTVPNRILSLRFTPTAPRSPQDVFCVVTPAFPADDDAEDVVSYRYTWSCPEKGQIVHGPSEALSDTLSHTRTAKGDTWTCTVEPYDGGVYGPAFTRQVSVVNSPPSLEVLGQKGAYPDQSIHLTIISSDDDGDSIALANPDTPPDATFDPGADGAGAFFWPHPGESLSQEISFSASDGSDETVEVVLVTFSETRLEIGSVEKTGNEQTLVITWYALPGVTYSVHRSSDLQSWHSVAPAVSLPEGSRSPDWLTYQEEISGSPSTARYYRVRM